MSIKTKGSSAGMNGKKKNNEKYVLLCALSENDVSDARKTAAEINETGVGTRVITCYNKKYRELYKLAENDNCIYCGLFTHIPVPDEIARRLCDKVRLYSFMQENDHDRREGERRSGQDRRKGDRRTGDRRSGDRRNGDRRSRDRRTREDSAVPASADGASIEERRGGDRRGSDRRVDDRRSGDRRTGERRVIPERRSGVDRRSGAPTGNHRKIYTVLVDSGLPEEQQVRSFPKADGINAVTLASVNEDSPAAGTVNGSKTGRKPLSARVKALIIAAALVLIYLLLYLASFYGCIGSIY